MGVTFAWMSDSELRDPSGTSQGVGRPLTKLNNSFGCAGIGKAGIDCDAATYDRADSALVQRCGRILCD